MAFDHALVLEQLEQRVDGTRAGAPGASGESLKPVHQLVAVGGTIQQRGEDEIRDHAPAHAAAVAQATATAMMSSVSTHGCPTHRFR